MPGTCSYEFTNAFIFDLRLVTKLDGRSSPVKAIKWVSGPHMTRLDKALTSYRFISLADTPISSQV